MKKSKLPASLQLNTVVSTPTGVKSLQELHVGDTIVENGEHRIVVEVTCIKGFQSLSTYPKMGRK